MQFEVGYKMSLGKYNRDMSIAMGVLSSLGFIYAFFLTWAWSRRAGKIAIDFVTLIKFVLHLCGSLANVFFVVIFGASLWWWIFYKASCTSSTKWKDNIMLITSSFFQ